MVGAGPGGDLSRAHPGRAVTSAGPTRPGCPGAERGAPGQCLLPQVLLETRHRCPQGLVAGLLHQGERVVPVSFGLPKLAAQRAGAAAIVDPRLSAPAEIVELYAQYPHIGPVLPAAGYSSGQLRALRLAIDAADADLVVAADPVDLAALLRPSKPVVRVRYEFEDLDSPGLSGELERFLAGRFPRRAR